MRGMPSVEAAEELARERLEPLGNRWAHTRVPNAAISAVGPGFPATGATTPLKQLREHMAAQPLAGLGVAEVVGTLQAALQQPHRSSEPVTLVADLAVIVVGEQRQRQHQIGDHVRGQLAVRALLPHPAHRDRLIDQVTGTAETSTPSDT
jgi:hypothetical protein